MDMTVVARPNLEVQQAAPRTMGVDISARHCPVEPSLVFTEYHTSRRVFAPHSHAGIAVVTNVFPGRAQGFGKRDSLGDRSQIGPGGLHVTWAGRGIFDDEFPRVPGIDAHGLQIWIPRQGDPWASPAAFLAGANGIDEVTTSDFKVAMVPGEFGEKQAVPPF